MALATDAETATQEITNHLRSGPRQEARRPRSMSQTMSASVSMLIFVKWAPSGSASLLTSSGS
jgi:hypothetical protein